MTQYIDKSALLAEIERRKKCIRMAFSMQGILHGHDRAYASAQYDAFNSFLSFIDTLEVKEVDLEKEIKDYFNNQPIITRNKCVNYQLIPSGENIAKHFFELGLKVKGE